MTSAYLVVWSPQGVHSPWLGHDWNFRTTLPLLTTNWGFSYYLASGVPNLGFGSWVYVNCNVPSLASWCVKLTSVAAVLIWGFPSLLGVFLRFLRLLRFKENWNFYPFGLQTMHVNQRTIFTILPLQTNVQVCKVQYGFFQVWTMLHQQNTARHFITSLKYVMRVKGYE